MPSQPFQIYCDKFIFRNFSLFFTHYWSSKPCKIRFKLLRRWSIPSIALIYPVISYVGSLPTKKILAFDALVLQILETHIRVRFSKKNTHALVFVFFCFVIILFKGWKIYGMFHVSWTTFSVNITHLGMVLPYITWLWLITFPMWNSVPL